MMVSKPKQWSNMVAFTALSNLFVVAEKVAEKAAQKWTGGQAR